MHMLICIIVLTSGKLMAVLGGAPTEVVFFISSQDIQPQNQLSQHLKENLIAQRTLAGQSANVNVHILRELFNYPGDWTILHLIPHLLSCTTDATKPTDDVTELITNNTQWIVFCEDTTNINVQLLLNRLNDENHTQPLFLGHALHDQEPTIIHHFAFSKNPKWFPYPMLSAGIVLSLPLVKSITDVFCNRNNHRVNPILRSEFSIDAAHELARFIYDNVQIPVESTQLDAFDSSHSDIRNPNEIIDEAKMANTTRHKKILLKKTSYICAGATGDNGRHDAKCAMYAAATPSPVSCIPTKRHEIYFAIKTCSKYHKERLPIIQNTWGSYAKHIKYFSDVQDDEIPTVSTNVPNVEVGHCAKTLKILKLALADIASYNDAVLNNRNHNVYQHMNHRLIQWLFLADDDTLLSISGVCQTLGCFDATDEIYFGERYGYRLYAPDGFNYITGGGGIAFSLPVVKLIVQHCSCPSPSAPDDMILGTCLHSLQVKAIHSPRFHQARPIDYPMERLRYEEPISFHKFWQSDPVEVYHQWFFDEDDRLLLMEANDVVPMEEITPPETGDITVYHHKNRNLLAQPEVISFNDLVPVSLFAALHHSKERHIDL